MLILGHHHRQIGEIAFNLGCSNLTRWGAHHIGIITDQNPELRGLMQR